MRSGAKAARVTIGRLLCVLALGVSLAGCDKCGDWWFSPWRADSQACREQAPKPAP